MAWIKWARQSPRFSQPLWRSTLGFAGLVALSLQTVFVLLFEVHPKRIGEFAGTLDYFFLLGRIDFYLFLFVLLAAIFGKGRFRLAICLSSAALEALWLMLGMMS
jgi:hypothetical protein